MMYALLVVPFVSALMTLVTRTLRQATVVAILGSSLTFFISTIVGVRAIFGPAALFGGGMWYLDAFAGMLVILIGLVQWSAAVSSAPYLEEEVHEGVLDTAKVRRYFLLFGFFVTSMFATVIANNLGLMWIALEATTLATPLLVGFYSRKGSLEAAWKYLILCSTGISLGLVGLLLTYYAGASSTVLHSFHAINWTDLHSAASTLPGPVLKIAFIFILIGFGTKAGLVPMHAWLPDAHSSAPAPISGMLSGVLLNAALFAVIRYKAIVDGALGAGDWTNGLLLAFGVLSCAIPAAFIIAQTDYKRLLAYSSIEHMGIITFSIGLGGIGAIAAVVHMIGHALAKSALFFGAGNIVLRFKSTKFEKVSGVITALPYTGTLFAVMTMALLASPPSPLFMSEYIMVATGITNHPLYTAGILLALVIIFAGFIRAVMPLLFARMTTAHENTHVKVGESWNASHVAVTFQLVLLLIFGISLWSTAAFGTIQHIALIITS